MPDSDDDENTNDDENSDANDKVQQTHQLADSTPSAAIPPSRFYSKAPKPAKCGQDTEAYIHALEGEVAVLRCQNEELAAHAIMAFDQVQGLKHRLNGKASKLKRRKLNTDSRWLNSEEGLAQCERQEAEAEAEAARKQVRAYEKQAEEEERQRQREQRDPNEPFVGSLNGRKKAELQDIAYALGLEIEGQVEDLKSRINAHFNENEEQRTSPRYIGLFPQLARQARQTINAPAPTSTPFPSTSALRIITNAMPPNNQQSPFLENHQLTMVPTHRPGLYWPSGLMPPGYVAHIPSYYNVTT
jgi:hypothetical protein